MTSYFVDEQTARVRGYDVWSWKEAWQMIFDIEKLGPLPIIPGLVPTMLELFKLEASGCIDSPILDMACRKTPEDTNVCN